MQSAYEVFFLPAPAEQAPGKSPERMRGQEGLPCPSLSHHSLHLSSTPQPRHRSLNLNITAVAGKPVLPFKFFLLVFSVLPSSSVLTAVPSQVPGTRWLCSVRKCQFKAASSTCHFTLKILAQMCGPRAAGMILKHTSLIVGQPGNAAEAEYFSFHVALASEIPIHLLQHFQKITLWEDEESNPWVHTLSTSVNEKFLQNTQLRLNVPPQWRRRCLWKMLVT